VPRLLILTTPELAPGYRMAGVATVAIEDAEEAAEALTDLLAGGAERGIVAVHEPHLEALAPAVRRRVDASDEPLVVALPAGEVEPGASERRARLVRMLTQTVGFRMSFQPDGGS